MTELVLGRREYWLKYITLIVILQAQLSSAVYIKLREKQTKCFIENIVKNEVVLLIYRSPDQAALPANEAAVQNFVGVKLVASSASGTVFESKLDKEGRLAFTSSEDGDHNLCFRLFLSFVLAALALYSTLTRMGSIDGQTLGQDFRVYIQIQLGTAGENNDALLRRDHLSSMELRVRKLSDEISRVQEQQRYFKQRESRFYETTKSTHERAQWCSIMQIVAMIVISLGNLTYLRTYFMAKKLM
ncbi:hypothetical protein GUITHDRAFT_137302 [Guillardia theta CCMP2712]|uniref:GOLD domain-containing protein n=1 Tax=Guillardia theta (strain CCMP2712) TaxID=905079 RepID=L1JG67_GUITC|nr:hypothetical protein GUITHDRAFT_137302 [Guillardia theta CCMP2712]EKX47513.1 hypothetical protein GUITHDRAFT_137302 [Guillardia theta CCMP2712]|eukprot:XP_005834493.1 hypothetical protein GUITHDRAFT_137302 [Guillardia theta CCMP2712]